MAFLKIESNNPDFSFIIRKNPESGMTLKRLKKGTLFGWYTELTGYAVFFKDAQNEVSFKRDDSESFEYLNVSRYNSPLFVTNTIKDFFDSALKGDNENDKSGFKNRIFINMIEVRSPHYINLFQRHFSWVSLESEEVGKRNLYWSIQSVQKSIR